MNESEVQRKRHQWNAIVQAMDEAVKNGAVDVNGLRSQRVVLIALSQLLISLTANAIREGKKYVSLSTSTWQSQQQNLDLTLYQEFVKQFFGAACQVWGKTDFLLAEIAELHIVISLQIDPL
jgi:hypothetical protein